MQDSAIKFRTVTSQNADHRPPADVFPHFVSPNFDVLVEDPRHARAVAFAAAAIVHHRLATYKDDQLITTQLDDKREPIRDPQTGKSTTVRLAPPSRQEIQKKKKEIRALSKTTAAERSLKRELRRMRQSRAALKDQMDTNPDLTHAYYSLEDEIAARRDELDTLQNERKDQAAVIRADIKQHRGKRGERRAFVRSLAWHGIHPKSRELDDYMSRLGKFERRKLHRIAEKTFQLHHQGQTLESLRYNKAFKDRKVAPYGSEKGIARARKIHRSILRDIDRDLNPLSSRLRDGTSRAARSTTRGVARGVHRGFGLASRMITGTAKVARPAARGADA